jgi:hypothetical protein
MTILAAIVAFQAGQADGMRQITVGEAASVAQWFFRCVDMRPPPSVTAIEYEKSGEYSFGGVPRYRVQMTPASGFPYELDVNAISGDVLFVRKPAGRRHLDAIPGNPSERIFP